MLVVGSKIIGENVMSLQVEGRVAGVVQAVIDPNDLKVIAYVVDGGLVRKRRENILLTDDIREVGQIGLIIDSLDELVAREDVIRVDNIMGLNFSLIGLKVVTEDGQKLGKVSDYTIDTIGFTVYQIIVDRTFMKSFVDPELTINRSQIVEIDDYKIVVKNEKKEVKVGKKIAAKDFVPNFVNPFREPVFEPSDSRTLGE